MKSLPGKRNKYFFAVLVLLCLVVFQMKAGNAWHAGEAVLVALIVCAAVFPFARFFPLLLASVLLFNWQASWSRELLSLILLPIASYVAIRYLPGKRFANVLFLSVLAVVIFYAATTGKDLLRFPGTFLAYLAGGFVWAVALYGAFILFYGYEEKTSF